ncbi:MAG: hypothetical protein P8163_17085 [Candidatus Thiodiazotropha sp.]
MDRPSEIELVFSNPPLLRFVQREELENFSAALTSIEKSLGRTYPLLMAGLLTISSVNQSQQSRGAGRSGSTGGDDEAEATTRLRQRASDILRC